MSVLFFYIYLSKELPLHFYTVQSLFVFAIFFVTSLLFPITDINLAFFTLLKECSCLKNDACISGEKIPVLLEMAIEKK